MHPIQPRIQPLSQTKLDKVLEGGRGQELGTYDAEHDDRSESKRGNGVSSHQNYP